MLSHLPVNHHLRPLYRFLAALTGFYVLLFGIIGVIRTGSGGLFDRTDISVLGLRTNLAFAIASVVVGALLLLAVLAGRNIDAAVSFWGGLGFMLAGTTMIAVLRSDLNVLNFSIATVVVSFVIGMVLFTAGMYTRSAARPAAD
jgi:Domain of unknown function (DUF4383)